MSDHPEVPPAPLWSDDLTGLAVWMNGPFIEITMDGEGWSGRLTAEQIATMRVDEFSAALATARAWAARWDITTRRYAPRAVAPA
ncbi:hypothetical protein SEA_DMITRI_39 [Gordonia phage Dmitri]|nr:hypothetical protein SEA_DMITRI_39 [Gordonia phage Dmitri]